MMHAGRTPSCFCILANATDLSLEEASNSQRCATLRSKLAIVDNLGVLQSRNGVNLQRALSSAPRAEQTLERRSLLRGHGFLPNVKKCVSIVRVGHIDRCVERPYIQNRLAVISMKASEHL
jgi:hypothetical protein